MNWSQKSIQLSSMARGCHLITDKILSELDILPSISIGLLHIFIQHTSASLSINENADPDVRQVPPGDMPIVDAYKAYIGVFNQAAAANPVNASVDLGGVATAAFATTIRNYLASQRDKGAVLNTSLGVTLRPFVVADPRSATEVYVNDCQLDGSYWMDSAGNPLPGERAAVWRNGVLVNQFADGCQRTARPVGGNP